MDEKSSPAEVDPARTEGPVVYVVIDHPEFTQDHIVKAAYTTLEAAHEAAQNNSDWYVVKTKLDPARR